MARILCYEEFSVFGQTQLIASLRIARILFTVEIATVTKMWKKVLQIFLTMPRNFAANMNILLSRLHTKLLRLRTPSQDNLRQVDRNCAHLFKANLRQVIVKYTQLTPILISILHH